METVERTLFLNGTIAEDIKKLEVIYYDYFRTERKKKQSVGSC